MCRATRTWSGSVVLDATKFFETARERYRIKMRREQGLPREEWTQDKVFKEWRFCNVHREDDKTTRWFRDNIRQPLADCCAPHWKQLEATLIFRWFNKIETGEIVKDLLLGEWNEEEARRRLQNVHPLVTGAYMIKTVNGLSKLEGMLWAIKEAQPQLPVMVQKWLSEGPSLKTAVMDLKKLSHIGLFMAYEIVCDLRWTPVLWNAPDIMTWANAGPGATHALGTLCAGNRYTYNRNDPIDQVVMVGFMQELLAMSTNADYWSPNWRAWEMREVEHWLCEHDKYLRGERGLHLKRRYR